MTDNEIIKDLEICSNENGMCSECAYSDDYTNCNTRIAKDALDLINRQKAKIKRLEELLDSSVSSERNVIDNISFERTEAIKGFAERLKKCYETYPDDEEASALYLIKQINDIVEEMERDERI